MRRIPLVLTLALPLLAPMLAAHAGDRAGRQGGGIQTPPPSAPPGRGAAPAPAPAGTGLILGQVVDGVTGEPIADAVVQPGRGGSGGGGGRAMPASGAAAGPNVFQPVVTGADGQFVFRSLPPGAYAVSASLAGYVTGMVGQGRPGGPDRVLELAEGERIWDAKIRVWKYASITGTVLDDGGEPAVDVAVRAYRRLTVDGRPQLMTDGTQSATTDDRGRFRFSRLTPGDYVVVVPLTQSTMPAAVFDSFIQSMTGNATAPPEWFIDLMMSGGEAMFGAGPPVRVGDLLWSSSFPGMPPPSDAGRAASYRTTFYPAASTSAEASIITLRAGEERTGINMQLTLVPTARLSGLVMGPAGPMGNLAVHLQPVPSDSFVAALDLESGAAVTRPDGSFMFHSVPAGQYILRIVKMARSEMMMRALAGEFAAPPTAANPYSAVSPSTPTPSSTTALVGEQIVTVSDADVSGVVLMMRDGPRVSGRVEFELTPPRTAAQMIAEGGVVLTPLSSGAGGVHGIGGPDPAMLDAEGRFKTLGHAPDRYTVSFGRGGRGSAAVKSVIVNGRDVVNSALELRDVDVDIVIKVSDRFSTLSGIVRGPNGAAATGATTIVFPANYQASASSGLIASRVQMVAASRSGAYSVSGLVPGDYLVVAVDDADVSDNQDSAFFEALARGATRVTIGDAEKKTQELVVVRVRR